MCAALVPSSHRRRIQEGNGSHCAAFEVRTCRRRQLQPGEAIAVRKAAVARPRRLHVDPPISTTDLRAEPAETLSA